MKRASTRLRELIARGPTLYVPGCYNAMSAKVLEQAGFDAIYMTGYGTSLSLTGLPDVGLATMTEMVANARYIASAVRIPLVADADTSVSSVCPGLPSSTILPASQTGLYIASAFDSRSVVR